MSPGPSMHANIEVPSTEEWEHRIASEMVAAPAIVQAVAFERRFMTWSHPVRLLADDNRSYVVKAINTVQPGTSRSR